MARSTRILLAGSVLILAAAGCAGRPATTALPSPPAPSSTPLPATPTSEPLAALVEGQPITLAAYQAEVGRFEVAQTTLGTDLATLGDYQSQVLQAMIDRRLLADGALEAGQVIEDAALEARMADLTQARGGNEAMGAWLAANNYDTVQFKADLEIEMLAAWMVNRISSQVPERMEEVHASQIMVASREQAQQILDRLKAGENFGDLAAQYSLDLSTRKAGGDLGWFPRGILLVKAVEDAAFALQPGEVSDIVQSPMGYHIVMTEARGEHLLSSDARWRLQEQAVKDWLESRRQAADIQVFVSP
jgi:parvulin-like peptidyl-prolyl isomerase